MTDVKRDRSAFIYMAPLTDQGFAQCATCEHYMPGEGACRLIGPDFDVGPGDSCGVYVHGEPDDEGDALELMDPDEVGFVRDEQVRCEHCESFDGKSKCLLFEALNKLGEAAHFDHLDEEVDAEGCCNAWKGKAGSE